jgi:hypothetical protein
MAFIAVTWNEHRMWSPKPPPFGGYFADDRSITQATADLVRFGKDLYRLRELVSVDPSLSDEAGYVDNLVTWTKQRIALLEDQRVAAERQAVANAQAVEIRARYGLRPPAPERSVEDARTEAHARELAALSS